MRDSPYVVGAPVVNRCQIEVHLAGMLRFELPFLQVDDDEASELQVIKQQVEIEILASDVKMHLAADNRTLVCRVVAIANNSNGLRRIAMCNSD